MILELRGLIYGKFRTSSDLARHLGWPRQRLNKITCGQKIPNITEVRQIADALDVPIETIADFFCKNSHQMGNKRAEGKD